MILQVQLTLIITNSLGPVGFLCHIEIQAAGTVKYGKVSNFGTGKVAMLYHDFVVLVFFIMRAHCISRGFQVNWDNVYCELVKNTHLLGRLG